METPPEGTETEAPARKPFAAVLQELQGHVHAELGEKLAEVVSACIENERVGSLTLKLTVKPSDDGMTVQLLPDIKTSKPEPARRTTTMFADENCNLGRRNPYQQELPLQEVVQPQQQQAAPIVVGDGKGDLHVVNPGTGEVIGG